MRTGHSNLLNCVLIRDRVASVKEHNQLELFADRAPIQGSSNAPPALRLASSNLSDVALIAALPDSMLDDACVLAAEAARRRLSGRARACGVFAIVSSAMASTARTPEQAAALEALAAIGGPDASRSVGQMIAKGIVQGQTLAVAVAAASRLGVIFPPDVALMLLRHSSPSVRASACGCVRARRDIVTTLIELLGMTLIARSRPPPHVL